MIIGRAVTIHDSNSRLLVLRKWKYYSLWNYAWHFLGFLNSSAFGPRKLKNLKTLLHWSLKRAHVLQLWLVMFLICPLFFGKISQLVHYFAWVLLARDQLAILTGVWMYLRMGIKLNLGNFDGHSQVIGEDTEKRVWIVEESGFLTPLRRQESPDSKLHMCGIATPLCRSCCRALGSRQSAVAHGLGRGGRAVRFAVLLCSFAPSM